MVEIRKVDTADKKQTGQFVQFHYDLYKGDPNWVPPFRSDIYMMMNRKKHPFYEHSDAEFFTAWKDGKMVGRIAGLNNNSYNNFHHLKTVNFFLYDSIDDQEVCNALFDAVAEWGKEKGEDTLVGPKGFSLYDGYGILVEGYEYRQMMNMSSYNYPYYKTLLENYGFEKLNDFVSMNFTLPDFNLPEKVYKAVPAMIKKFGKPDILVCAAGLGFSNYFEKISDGDFKRIMEINVFGIWFTLKAFYPYMAGRKTNIVLLSSLAGLIGIYGYSAYGTSKFAVFGLADCLRSEFKEKGICLSALIKARKDKV